MALSVLYIGGTGQISLPCLEASLAAGHDVTVLNRRKTPKLQRLNRPPMSAESSRLSS